MFKIKFFFFGVIFSLFLLLPTQTKAASCNISLIDTFCSDTTAANGTALFALSYTDNSGNPASPPGGTFTPSQGSAGVGFGGGTTITYSSYAAGSTNSNPSYSGGGASCSYNSTFYIHSCMLRPTLGTYKRVFVTKDVFTSNLFTAASTLGLSPANGLDAADKICNKKATDAGLGSSTWTAWLSSSTVSAATRLVPTNTSLPYILVNQNIERTAGDARIVASNWSQLLLAAPTRNPASPINVVEDGTLRADTPTLRVWTNTKTNGTISQLNTGNDYARACNDWTGTPSFNTTVGDSAQKNTSWTEVQNLACNQPGNQFRLYCFEK